MRGVKFFKTVEQAELALAALGYELLRKEKLSDGSQVHTFISGTGYYKAFLYDSLGGEFDAMVEFY